MFLYVLIFLNSCLSTPSRQISNIKEDYKYWYLGFDEQLKREDSFWSPKLYYSPALDNLRKFGAYTYTEKNEIRNYSGDMFDDKGGSLYPTLEKLLLVLFPSPSGSLSTTSASNTNLNTFISRLPISDSEHSDNTNNIEGNVLTKEIALAKVLNIAYKILSLKKEINTLNHPLIENLKKEFKEYYTKNKANLDSRSNPSSLNTNSMVNKILNLLIDFIQKTDQNKEEKGLIQHAFMKWALMHVEITNSKSITILIDKLSFFEKVSESDNVNKLFKSNESEKLFQETGIGFSHPENIYLTNSPFENGQSYAFDSQNKQTQESFPDCVETTIRHFFNYTLKKDGKFQILDKFHPKLKEYYTDATDAKVLGTDIASRTAWNRVVSHIPGAEYSQNGNNLKSNISNILHVIEYLLTSESKNFQKITTYPEFLEKFTPIKSTLDKIKPILPDKSSTINNEHTFNNFFIINIRNNAHAFATIQRSNDSSKILKIIDPNDFNILEYTFLTNFFNFNISPRTMPLFHFHINDITSIFNFFEKSNKFEKDYLDTFSSYIGRVLSSALWEDITVVKKIYNDENLSNLINIVTLPENILQGVKLLSLEFGTAALVKGIVQSSIQDKLLLLGRIKTLFIADFTSKKISTLIQIINKNNTSMKDIYIIEQENSIDEILEAICSCIHLKKLEIKYSLFKKPLPSRLGDLINLDYLNISSNQLNGPIPQELKNLSQLTILNLSRNKLQEKIPQDLRNLTQLKSLLLSNNNLQGPIPKGLGDLTQLSELNLSKNNLQEKIPQDLCKLTQLITLNLSSNQLQEKIPQDLRNLTQLKSLLLSNNNLQGPIPQGLENLSLLTFLDLSKNLLEGPIPNTLGKLTQLFELNLSFNKLTGSIPKELENLIILDSLNLSSNQLTGFIPKELEKLTSLDELNLTLNQLSGTIPKVLEKHEETINPQIKITTENSIKKEEKNYLLIY